MTRYVSFVLLVAVIILLGIVFYKVMAGFLIPLFLAALMVVIFSPMFERLTLYFQRYRFLTKRRRAEKLSAGITTTAVSLVVLVPVAIALTLAANEARQILTMSNTARLVEKLKEARTNLGLDLPAANEIRGIQANFVLLQDNMKPEDIEYQRQLLFEIKDEAVRLGAEYELVYPTDIVLEEPADPSAEQTPWLAFGYKLNKLRQLNDQLASSQSTPEQFHDYQVEMIELEARFRRFKNETLLATNGWLKEMVNPSEQKLVEYSDTVFNYVSNQLLKFGTAGTSFIGSMLVGIATMLFAFFFFLLDGKSMIESLKGLSPLDDQHEQELVDEFSKVSRAVVLATLLSAVAQGILAGIGYYFVGLDSIFLLTIMTTCLALVPFVGAAAVWVPCALYLFFFENSIASAIGLAIYGTLVISMVDNFIKPMVLHGQSNLHPLLAFLSIIGGVSALGPIGILIGPMVVAFLQTLLEILQREIRALDTPNDVTTEPNG